jgi:Na+/proline symporter
MSSLDSSMNSISTAYITDIHQRFKPGMSDQKYLRIAKQVTILVGIFGTTSAMVIAALNVQFLFDLFQEVLGMMGGSLAGVFILGIFTKRTNAPGAVCGVMAGVIVVWLVRHNTDISLYLYGAVGVITCVMVGYFMSFFFPPKKNL